MFKERLLSTALPLCAVSLVLLLSPPAEAHGQAARRIDEFADIQASDLIARLDNFAIELQNEPDAKGFLIVYRARRDMPGLSNRYAHRMKSYLISFRGLPPDRLVTVDGGVASCLTQEIWVVPRGAAPRPREDVYSYSYQPTAYKFDEHHYSSPYDMGHGYWADAPEDLFGHLEAFAQTLRKDPALTGYLVAYGAVDRDGPGVTRGMLQKERNYLIKTFGIKPSRLKTIDGGLREWRTMELWVVQKGDYTPVINTYGLSRNRRRR